MTPNEALAQKIAAELRDQHGGRRARPIAGRVDPWVVRRVQQILAGETLPRYENPDD